MRRALIFGISGQDGAYLAHLLLKKGYEVVGVSRDAELASFTKLKRLGIHARIRYLSASILFNHESPLRPARFVTRKIVAAARRIAAGSAEPLRLGNIDIVRDWGWAPEYVDAMWRMLQQDEPDDYVIATGRSCALRDFVAEAFAAVDLDWRRHVQLDSSLLRPTEIEASHADPSKAAQRLDWHARMAVADIVREMVAQEDLALESGPRT